eukprot:m.56713 g.56713  ORF g.56713 m.56713 type:complete len:123 (-) comp48979_c0_seq2:58-426(-)
MDSLHQRIHHDCLLPETGQHYCIYGVCCVYRCEGRSVLDVHCTSPQSDCCVQGTFTETHLRGCLLAIPFTTRALCGYYACDASDDLRNARNQSEMSAVLDQSRRRLLLKSLLEETTVANHPP